ncbi:hypothetical protein Tco_0149625, partial [Tanacetum coccineum]
KEFKIYSSGINKWYQSTNSTNGAVNTAHGVTTASTQATAVNSTINVATSKSAMLKIGVVCALVDEDWKIHSDDLIFSYGRHRECLLKKSTKESLSRLVEKRFGGKCCLLKRSEESSKAAVWKFYCIFLRGINGAVNTAHGAITASTQATAVNLTTIDNLSDVVICAFFASQPKSPQLNNEDLQLIHPDDLEEMDLRWQMAMLNHEGPPQEILRT